MGIARRLPGLRRIRRPETGHSPAFDLTYVRTGPRAATPVVVIPGGPGMASVLPYRGFRRMAAAAGLDVIMVEHRGIGFSRNDPSGEPLPHSAMWVDDVVDDIAAVLDAEGVTCAFVVGSSYGSYLAASFGVRHPERVAGMLLDSALQSAADLALERQAVRGLFWDAQDDVAAAVQELEGSVEDHGLLDVVRAAYELGGYPLLRPLLQQRLRHPRSITWKLLESYALRGESIARMPYFYEFDLAGAIGYRELDYGAAPDGLPLDPALTYAPIAHLFPAFAGEPYDLPTETTRFDWPMVLVAGKRDLRTPPTIARRVAENARDAVLVEIDKGHSSLEAHPAAIITALRHLVHGTKEHLTGMGEQLDALPPRGYAARLPSMLQAALRVERRLRR